MILPTTNKESQLLRIGHEHIAGVDEVGRGPLAGPVVASAVIFSLTVEKGISSKEENQKSKIKNQKIGRDLIRDSKLLSEKQRLQAYNWITQSCLSWSVGIISQEGIDKIGIRQASLAAMAEAVSGLSQKPDAVLIDGKDIIESLDIYQEAVIKGDRDVFSIAAASIIAKVTRDEIMKKFDAIFPQYGFAGHKGYGTVSHYENLEIFGECRLHRKSFRLKTDSHG